MSITIRQADVRDSAGLIELASWWPVGSRIVPRDASGYIDADAQIYWLGDPGWCILVAVDDETNAIIGYAVGYEIQQLRADHGRPDLSAKAETTRRVANLEELHVLPEYERRGIGTRLVRVFEEWARQTGCVISSLAGGPAPEFYEKLGYKRQGSFFSYVKIL